MTSCIGDTVTYTCTVNAVGHGWNISLLPEVVTVTRSGPRKSEPPYMFRLIGDEVVGPINSTLSLTVFAGFNGTSITCEDSNLLFGVKQSATAMVFGECCTGCSKLSS